MPRKKTKKKSTSQKKNRKTTGGIAFYISLICLVILANLNLRMLPLLWDSVAYENTTYALAGLSIGCWFAYIFVKGRFNVFVHEFKHALLSGLAGNKATGLKIDRESGHFSYKHSKENEKYNALIALAPYFMPLFTVFSLVLAFIFFRHSHHARVVVASLGFGCDLLMNFRDVSPVQSDINKITGGYKIGLIFIVAMNVTIATFFFAWVFQDLYGLKVLLSYLWEFGVNLFWFFRTR